MAASGTQPTDVLGYLAFVEIPQLGIVGGYLAVNQRARPIEFHCTAPVMRNRTQEILYGSTFRAALLCDQIGMALLKQVTNKPKLLITDDPDATGLRRETGIALALLFDEELAGAEATTKPSEWSYQIAGHSVTSAPGFDDDRETIRDTIRNSDASHDLSEPLNRIRAAINEAQRAAA